MDLLRACAHGTAWTSALLDGALVGGWLATRELDDRPRTRRRVRVLLCSAFGAQALAGELAWQVLVGPGHPAAEQDRRATGSALAVAVAATVLLAPVHRRAPAGLARRGVQRPHLVFGLVVGAAYAASTLPVWRAQARRRVTAAQAPAAPPAAQGPAPAVAPGSVWWERDARHRRRGRRGRRDHGR